METITLKAQERGIPEKSRHLRRTGRIPAIYYGHGKPNRLLHVDSHQFKRVFDRAGENTVIELELGSEKFPVLIYEVQFDPVSDRVQHVDFMHVDMEKEVTTSVKVLLTGVAPAVKNLGGILDIHKHELRIRCLPKDLIHEIAVDILPLADFHTAIHVKDLVIPPGIKILDKPEDTVVTVAPPRKEEEEVKPVSEAPAAAPGEVLAAGEAGKPAPAGAGGTAPGGATTSAGQAKEEKKK